MWVGKGVSDLVALLRFSEELKKSFTSLADHESAYREVFWGSKWHRRE